MWTGRRRSAHCRYDHVPVDILDECATISFRMSTEVLQGTLDLVVLRTLDAMGAQHGFGLAKRILQVSEGFLDLNQGTLYPALVRLEQKGWIKGTWQKTESNREAKYYAITKPGSKALEKQTERWRRISGFVNTLLLGEPS